MKQTNYYFLSFVLILIAIRNASLAFGSSSYMMDHQLLERLGMAWIYYPTHFILFLTACAMLLSWVKPLKPYSYKILLGGLILLLSKIVLFGLLGGIDTELSRAAYEASQVARGVTPNPEMLDFMFSLPGAVVTTTVIFAWFYFLFTIIRRNRSFLE